MACLVTVAGGDHTVRAGVRGHQVHSHSFVRQFHHFYSNDTSLLLLGDTAHCVSVTAWYFSYASSLENRRQILNTEGKRGGVSVFCFCFFVVEPSQPLVGGTLTYKG